MYRVYAVIDGEQGDYSNTVSVQIPSSGVRPPAPSISTASAATSSTTIVVSWSQVARGHKLRASVQDGRWGILKPHHDKDNPVECRDSPSYTHRGRSAGTKYTYQVRSKNVNGDSDWSAAESHRNALLAPSTGGQRLATPRNLNAENDSDEDNPNLKVSWGSVTDANGYELLQWGPGTTTTAWAASGHSQKTPTSIAEIVKNGSYYHCSPWFPQRPTTSSSAPLSFRLNDQDGLTANETEDDTSEWSAPFSGTTKSL